jgi:ATP-binding protein involved in chromosome partitioning
MQVVSMGLILDEDEVLTWFHDMKRNATEELLCHVLYGERDYLIIDVPAGTSSDTVNLIQYIPELDGATVVTVPSEVSQAVAWKAVTLCQKAKVKVFGLFENQGTYICSQCGEKEDIFQAGGGEKLASKLNIPFLGSIPLSAQIAECSDEGIPFVYKYPESEGAKVIMKAVDLIEEQIWRG